MRYLLLLLPLAAHAAASPCDPRCDPKAKAKAAASVATCDPKVGAQVVTVPGLTRATASSPAVVVQGQGSCGNVVWHEIATAPAGAVASCTISSGTGTSCTTTSCAPRAGATATCTVTCRPSTTCNTQVLRVPAISSAQVVRAPAVNGAQVVRSTTTCNTQVMRAPAASSAQVMRAPAACSAQVMRAPSVASPNLSVPAPAASSFSSPDFTITGFDEPNFEMPSFFAAGIPRCSEADDEDEVEDADVADAMEALSELRAIELEAAAEGEATSLPALAERVRQQRANAERSAQAAQKDMQRALEVMHSSEYAEAMAQAKAATEGLLALGYAGGATRELAHAGGDNRYFLGQRALASTDDGDADDLESRVRALERIARQQGHAPIDGSLEERVAALERALSGGKSGSGRGQSPAKVYALGKDGLRAYRGADAEKLREMGRSGVWLAPTPTPPMPAPPAAPQVRRFAPTPTAPVAPADPFARQRRDRTPAPQATSPRASSNDSSDERREIEESMRTLREEAEELRAELQRMRERIESLPRGGR